MVTLEERWVDVLMDVCGNFQFLKILTIVYFLLFVQTSTDERPCTGELKIDLTLSRA